VSFIKSSNFQLVSLFIENLLLTLYLAECEEQDKMRLFLHPPPAQIFCIDSLGHELWKYTCWCRSLHGA